MVHSKIDFEISSNPIADIGEREIFVQIISPDENIIHDMDKGSGTFLVNNIKTIYSVKQNIMYDRKNQLVNIIFDRPEDYDEGEHKVKIWCENEVIGRGSFTIK